MRGDGVRQAEAGGVKLDRQTGEGAGKQNYTHTNMSR